MNWKEKSKEMWGVSWQATLSKMCKLNPRTIRRWVSGENNIHSSWICKIDKTYEIWNSKEEISNRNNKSG